MDPFNHQAGQLTSPHKMGPELFLQAMQKLLTTVQRLSLARDLEKIMSIVRFEARELTGADGATFVLRDGDECYYAEENAIAPLWKGKRFPMKSCISGWVMINRRPAIIEDIYADIRIPADAYRPTFVKSLVMVPIRTEAPIGAIGNYWAKNHHALPEEVKLLQALADSTSIAMENVQLYSDLEQRVKNRTTQLELINKELEAFSYTVSHDLRSPIQAIQGFCQLLLDEYTDKLDRTGQNYLENICVSIKNMNSLVEDLLKLARISRSEMTMQEVNLSELVHELLASLTRSEPKRETEFLIEDGLLVKGDPGLIRIMLENLLNNAWKFTSKKPKTRLEFRSIQEQGQKKTYLLRDNGAGFDMQQVDRLFNAFQRLHRFEEFPGTGIGLATVAKIVQLHGGTIRAESVNQEGSTFYFTL